VHNGMLTELTYSIAMKKSSQIQNFMAALKNLNSNNKVTLITGYNATDL
jgi:archaellum biogenesis ATPase FlaH